MASNRPVGVSIISFLFLLGGILAIVAGLVLLEEIFQYPKDYPASELFTGSDAETNFIILILVGVILIFLSIGLFSGRYWAYNVVLVIVLLLVIARLTYMTFQALDASLKPEIDEIFFWQIATLTLNLLILWYLLDRRDYFLEEGALKEPSETV
ncbi:MAG: hypothetical protein ACFE68_02820 [Candidatus Hodarchaeota archaeon]